MVPKRSFRMGRMALALGLLAVAGWVWQREWTAVLQPDPPVLLDIRDDIRTVEDLAQWPGAHGAFENDGFVPCLEGSFSEAGWCLPPGRQGALRLILPELPQARGLLARVFFFRKQPEATSRLAVYREGEAAARMVFDNVHFADARLDLSPALSGPGGRVVLSFEGDNPTSRPDVFVQYFEIRAVAVPLPVLPALPLATAAFLSVGLCLLPLVSWRRLLPLWGVLGLGVALRYYALQQVLWLPLDWDAGGYHHLAKQMTLFTGTGFYSAQFGERDPLFLLLLKGALALFGDSEHTVRVMSLCMSVLTIPLVWHVGSRLFNRWLGLLGALLVAVCLPLVRESVRGLRLEVELVLLLLLIEVAFVATSRPRWLRAGLAGFLSGCLSLLRSIYAISAIPVLLVAFTPWKRGCRLAAGVALLVMLGLWFPHRWSGHQRYGHWAWDSNGRWFANAEFAGRREGWPSKLDMWRDTMGGSRQEAWFPASQYFFGLHTPRELAEGSVRGFWKLLRHMEVIAFHGRVHRTLGRDLRWVDAVFQLAGVAGLILAAFTPGLRWMPLLFCALLVHAPFLYDRGLLEPWRHTYQAFPLMVFGALLAVSRVWSWLLVYAPRLGIITDLKEPAC